MGAAPDADIMQNGLEQLQQMIARDRNHPSIVVWGLCNEIYGQSPPAYQFAKRLLEEAKRLGPESALLLCFKLLIRDSGTRRGRAYGFHRNE
jgi:beta-glucuronidase